jgi:hypothetical protein
VNGAPSGTSTGRDGASSDDGVESIGAARGTRHNKRVSKTTRVLVLGRLAPGGHRCEPSSHGRRGPPRPVGRHRKTTTSTGLNQMVMSSVEYACSRTLTWDCERVSSTSATRFPDMVCRSRRLVCAAVVFAQMPILGWRVHFTRRQLMMPRSSRPAIGAFAGW